MILLLLLQLDDLVLKHMIALSAGSQIFFSKRQLLYIFNIHVRRKTFSLRILPKMLTFISRFVICALFTCQARNRKNFEYGSLVMIREKIRNKSFLTLEKWQVQHISLPKKSPYVCGSYHIYLKLIDISISYPNYVKIPPYWI